MWGPNTDDCNCQHRPEMKFSHEESLRGVDIEDISVKQAVTSFFTFLVFGFSVWWLLFGQESFQKKKLRRKNQKQQQRTRRKRVCKIPRKQQHQQGDKKRNKKSSRSSVPKALIFKTIDDDKNFNRFSDDETVDSFSEGTFSDGDNESRNNLSDEDNQAEDEDECKLVLTDCSCDESDQQTASNFDLSDHATLISALSSRTNESKLEHTSSSKSSSGNLEESYATADIMSGDEANAASSKLARIDSSRTPDSENNGKIKPKRSSSSCDKTDPVICEKNNILQTVVFSIQGNLNGDCAAMLCNVLEYQVYSIHRVSINLVTATATIRYYGQKECNDFDQILQVLERFNVKASVIPEKTIALSKPTQIGPIQRPTRRSSMVETRSRDVNTIQRPEIISKFERHMSI